MPPRRTLLGAKFVLDANGAAPLIGQCIYISSGVQTCADVTEAWCKNVGGRWDPNERCPT